MALVVHQNYSHCSLFAVDGCYYGEPVQDNEQLDENVFTKFMMVFKDSMIGSSYWCLKFHGFLPVMEVVLPVGVPNTVCLSTALSLLLCLL